MKKPTKAQIAARAKFVARFANASSAKKARSASGAPRVRKLGRNPKGGSRFSVSASREGQIIEHALRTFAPSALRTVVARGMQEYEPKLNAKDASRLAGKWFLLADEKTREDKGYVDHLNKYGSSLRGPNDYRKNPVRTGAKRRPPKRNPSRRMPEPKGFVIRAQSPVNMGYKYYYLRGESFVLDSAHGDLFTKPGGEKRMHEIHGALPRLITSITLVKV